MLFVSIFFAVSWFLATKGAPVCYNKATISFTSENGLLKVNGNHFKMKGISWFGFETKNKCVHGLWAQSYTFFLDILQQNKFNAIRMPFSLDLALNDGSPQGLTTSIGTNSQLSGKSSLQVLDKIILEAGKRGILIMLDMHSLQPDGYLTNSLWYDNQYTTAQNLAGWRKMVNRYKNSLNVFAIDVFNEPYGATWGDGAKTDLRAWAQTVGNLVHGMGVDWLVNVQGATSSPSCGATPCFWGENLMGVANNPVRLNSPNRLVYSPHVYGPDVHLQPYFSGNFPNNMPAIWEKHFGFVRKYNQAALVPGEWGGHMTGSTLQWVNKFVDYLISINARDTYYWCLNENSGDTGGLLKGSNWKTVDNTRLTMLARLQPNPTSITSNSAVSSLCFDVGNTPQPPPNNPQPTGRPTPRPPAPTPRPVTPPSGTTNIQIRVHKDGNQWWFAVWWEKKDGSVLSGVSDVKAQMAGSTTWVSGSRQPWGTGTVYAFQAPGTPWKMPVTLAFRVNGVDYRGCGTVTSLPKSGVVCDSNTIVRGTTCVGMAGYVASGSGADSGAGTGGTQPSNSGQQSSTSSKGKEWVPIVIGASGGTCCLLLSCAMVGWYVRRAKTNRPQFDDIEEEPILGYQPPIVPEGTTTTT